MADPMDSFAAASEAHLSIGDDGTRQFDSCKACKDIHGEVSRAIERADRAEDEEMNATTNQIATRDSNWVHPDAGQDDVPKRLITLVTMMTARETLAILLLFFTK